MVKNVEILNQIDVRGIVSNEFYKHSNIFKKQLKTLLDYELEKVSVPMYEHIDKLRRRIHELETLIRGKL